ncbi:MAG TPA: peptide chain release factor 3, partial [Ignavibacteria bacterium]|nr:peptide chain release factor 3 [Ignavibacteria bacterium]
MSALLKQIQSRRTFAIISHPDAGKTTLTEKLLLFGGAIQVAGAVKSNKIKRTAKSDFLEIEKQRGISVTTSVMNFIYNGIQINLLDTPGHKDFAEDTYRTLSAVDSVILVIDCAKGVEEQTEKLMNVCRMRNTPVIVFINKLDREGQSPMELLDEIEKKLNIRVCPRNWPAGMGYDLKGLYDLDDKTFTFFDKTLEISGARIEQFESHTDPALIRQLDTKGATFSDEIDIVNGVYGSFNLDEYRAGELAPVYFGSALKNFGVQELLDSFISIAPSPVPRDTTKGEVEPSREKFSGFVFKIHANLDARHRDRIAFLRVCSGKFERNTFYHHVRLDRKVKFPNPASFLAQDKKLVETAYPGDVIGLYDSGIFKIGDTLTEGEEFMYKGIPTFSPEIFKEVIITDP